jgi:hypothetical protein
VLVAARLVEVLQLVVLGGFGAGDEDGVIEIVETAVEVAVTVAMLIVVDAATEAGVEKIKLVVPVHARNVELPASTSKSVAVY